MVLIERRELVVHEDARLEIRWQVEPNSTVISLRDVGARIVCERPLRCRMREPAVGGTQVVVKVGDVREGGCGFGVAVGII